VTLSLSLRRDGGQCAMTVADNGPGIPPEIQHTVFERFARADRRHPGLTTGGAGAGLGLSITAAIVTAHDGALTVDSTPGSTVFTALLPTGAQEAAP
jgi:two-component system OmpR family sensor kinase